MISEKTFDKVEQLLLQGWTRHAFAKDKHSRCIEPTNKKAVKFCLLGAEMHTITNIDEVNAFRKFITKAIGHHDIGYFNDYECGSVEDVLQCVRQAKKLFVEEEKAKK